MFTSISKLKENGYEPKTIIDIGAHIGNWTNDCLNIYPKAKYFLFEAIHYEELNRFDGLENIEVTSNTILDETQRQIKWYQMKNTGDSMFREKTGYFNNCEVISRNTTTLNDVIDSTNLENVLIKIDCQGAEIPILKGASDVITKTDFIILEMPFFGQYNENVPGFLEHIKYMDSIGFIPYDLCELHHSGNFTIQIDIMFINKNHNLNKTVQEHFLSLSY